MIKKFSNYIVESSGEEYDQNGDRRLPSIDTEALDLTEEEDADVDEDEVPEEGGMEYICYLIRSLFKNSGVTVDITHKNFDISVFVFFQKKEKMKSLLKAFDVIYKLKKDILPQYECEVELYQNKSTDPVMAFQFSYRDEASSDAPF